MRKARGPKGGAYTFTPGGLVRLDVYLSPETKEALREAAFRERKSMSELAGEILAEYLERPRSRPPRKP